MKIQIKYSGKILNLPASVADFAPDASREELVVIIGLFSCVEYHDAFEKYIELFSEKLGIGVERIKKALLFWAEKGVISIDGMIDEVSISSASQTVPTYTGAQIAKFVEKNEDIRSLFLACQAIMGKEFNAHDHNNIIYLKDYYRFTNEYIMLFLACCVEIGKTNWAYIRKLAGSLYDEGIDTYTELEAHFENRRNKESLEYKIRELFGIGKRELSKNEKEKIERWLSLELEIELIRLAYGITVDKTGKPSLAYCAKIIENWLSCGVRSASEAEKFEAEKVGRASGSSFDTNDFFEAALRRSYNKKGES
ncbi:MAG: DnaD domain protein [Clostridia bacterium]|nr:DnaD domain protein [Clostridia bacterium]